MKLTEEGALRACAAMMNTIDVAKLSGLLTEEFHYSSPWVLTEIESGQQYVDYITPKLKTVKKSGILVWAEMAVLDRGFLGPCVMLAQGDKINSVALVFAKVGQRGVIQLNMCEAPSPDSARCTGDHPKQCG